jgi:hypothetical protein
MKLEIPHLQERFTKLTVKSLGETDLMNSLGSLQECLVSSVTMSF